MKSFPIKTESELCQLATALAKISPEKLLVFLQGTLGAGKTTFTRAFLQALGISERIKSPTYTLVESYKKNNLQIFHFDLYRLHDENELELIGLRDYFSEPAIIFIEWPERAPHSLPLPDITCYIHLHPLGRTVEIVPQSELGRALLEKLNFKHDA